MDGVGPTILVEPDLRRSRRRIGQIDCDVVVRCPLGENTNRLDAREGMDGASVPFRLIVAGCLIVDLHRVAGRMTDADADDRADLRRHATGSR